MAKAWGFLEVKLYARSPLWTCLILVLSSPVVAQVSTTSLRGVVADPAGAMLRGAQVNLTNPEIGFARTTATNDHGEYQFLQVPAGTYTIAASAPGFTSTRQQDVMLLVNTPAKLNFTLHRYEPDGAISAPGPADPRRSPRSEKVLLDAVSSEGMEPL